MKLVGLAFLLVASCGGRIIGTENGGSSESVPAACSGLQPHLSAPPLAMSFDDASACPQVGASGEPCYADGTCNPGLTCTLPTALDPNVRCEP
jgi:hypothetical protein